MNLVMFPIRLLISTNKKKKKLLKNKRQSQKLKNQNKRKKMEKVIRKTKFKSLLMSMLPLGQHKLLSKCRKTSKNIHKHGETAIKPKFLRRFMIVNWLKMSSDLEFSNN